VAKIGLLAGDLGARCSRVGAYAAPEQFVDAKSVGGVADVYALGLVLFELLRGKHPFATATSTERAHHRLTEKAPRLYSPHWGLPRGLIGLCSRMLDLNPAHRPSAQQVSEVLRKLPSTSRAVQQQTSLHLALPLLLLCLLGPPAHTWDSFNFALDRGTLSDGSEEHRTVATQSPDPARQLHKQADLKYEAGHLNEAAPLYKEAMEEHLRKGDLRRQLSCLNRLGDIQFHQGHSSEALPLYNETLQRLPMRPKPEEMRGDEVHLTLYRVALAATQQKNFELARDSLNRLMLATPKYVLWQSRAEELLASFPAEPAALGLAGNALEHAEEAKRSKPTDHKPELARMRAELRIGLLTANVPRQRKALSELYALWCKDTDRALWAHDFLEAAVQHLRIYPSSSDVRQQAHEVLQHLQANQQLTDDIHIAQYRREVSSLVLAPDGVLAQ
jgi:tetratricopeptide (TPR) repeat protein